MVIHRDSCSPPKYQLKGAIHQHHPTPGSPPSCSTAKTKPGPSHDRRSISRRYLLAVLVATLLGAGVSSASPNPGDPGYCGARQDALDCVAYDGPAPPPPSRAEAAYLNSVRGHYPGDDATLLKMGGYLHDASRWRHHRLRRSRHRRPPRDRQHSRRPVAGRGDGYICPDIHIGANGADDSRPYH